jgi:hypothetical protein
MLSPYDFKKERSFYSKQVPQNVNTSTVTSAEAGGVVSATPLFRPGGGEAVRRR